MPKTKPQSRRLEDPGAQGPDPGDPARAGISRDPGGPQERPQRDGRRRLGLGVGPGGRRARAARPHHARDRARARRRRRRLSRRCGDVRRHRARGLPRLGKAAARADAPSTRSSAGGCACSGGSRATLRRDSWSRRFKRRSSRFRNRSCSPRWPAPSPSARSLPIEDLTAWMLERGMSRAEVVEVPGEFSSRGGILDVFPDRRDRPGAHRVLRRRDRVDPPVRRRIPALARPLDFGHADGGHRLRRGRSRRLRSSRRLLSGRHLGRARSSRPTFARRGVITSTASKTAAASSASKPASRG